jgi:hypothetical protein
MAALKYGSARTKKPVRNFQPKVIFRRARHTNPDKGTKGGYIHRSNMDPWEQKDRRSHLRADRHRFFTCHTSTQIYSMVYVVQSLSRERTRIGYISDGLNLFLCTSCLDQRPPFSSRATRPHDVQAQNSEFRKRSDLGYVFDPEQKLVLRKMK